MLAKPTPGGLPGGRSDPHGRRPMVTKFLEEEGHAWRFVGTGSQEEGG
jgi:hypothetical protein